MEPRDDPRARDRAAKATQFWSPLLSEEERVRLFARVRAELPALDEGVRDGFARMRRIAGQR